MITARATARGLPREVQDEGRDTTRVCAAVQPVWDDTVATRSYFVVVQSRRAVGSLPRYGGVPDSDRFPERGTSCACNVHW
ncbi:hypothetical protein GCM10018987_52790 [Streptomyces cremeus]